MGAQPTSRLSAYDERRGPPTIEERRTIAHLTTTQFIVAYVIASAAGVAIFLHADRSGSRHPTLWAISVFLFLGIALPIYFIHVYRSRRGRRY